MRPVPFTHVDALALRHCAPILTTVTTRSQRHMDAASGQLWHSCMDGTRHGPGSRPATTTVRRPDRSPDRGVPDHEHHRQRGSGDVQRTDPGSPGTAPGRPGTAHRRATRTATTAASQGANRREETSDPLTPVPGHVRRYRLLVDSRGLVDGREIYVAKRPVEGRGTNMSLDPTVAQESVWAGRTKPEGRGRARRALPRGTSSWHNGPGHCAVQRALAHRRTVRPRLRRPLRDGPAGAASSWSNMCD
jgi:hypothetical protein